MPEMGWYGVVWAGMGRDGLEGCRQLKRAGGFVFAQHQDDCVVYGMPKTVIEADLADRTLRSESRRLLGQNASSK